MALQLRSLSGTRRLSGASNQCDRRFALRSCSSPRLSLGRRSTPEGRPLREGIRISATQTEPTDTEAVEADKKPEEWIALIANAEFMLHDVQNESLAEQLREKVRHYGQKGWEINFFLVPEPVWLDALFPEKAKLVGRPCVALVSTDPVWMRFMKTRLDQVLEIRLGDLPKEEVLKAGGEIPEFEKPKIWRAPYSAYSPGWWEAFYPKEPSPEVTEPEAEEQEKEEE